MANPRLLLFGHAGAGKSSLLGALVQAAATQANVLSGELVGASTELTDLRNSTYQSDVEATTDVGEYEIRIQPTDPEASPLAATLLDCSGASAGEMLQAKQPFADSHRMQQPLLSADGVLLVADVSKTPKQLGEEFLQFVRWLNDFHQTRGRRTEVGELPVYLVLTKCDMLAKPNDTFAMWIQRIEEAKRRIDLRLREQLKDQGTGFGSITVNVWATSIKRPALADRQAKEQEPYGVAELFRQCLQTAVDYDFRQSVSQGRLQNVLVAALGVVAMLALAVGFLVVFQPEAPETPLDEEVRVVMPREGAKPEERLRGTQADLEKRLEGIGEIEKDARFARLPEKTREEIQQFKDEVAMYLKFYREERANLKPPANANEATFRKLEKKLQEYEFPKEYAEAWQTTPLGKRVAKLREEFAAMNAAVVKEEAWLREQTRLNKALTDEGFAIAIKLRDQDKGRHDLARKEADAWQMQYQKRRSAAARGSMPMLAVKVDDTVWAVDGVGVLMPPETPTKDLPLYSEETRPPQGPPGTPWGDRAVEAAARKLKRRFVTASNFQSVVTVRREWERSIAELSAIAESIKSRL